MDPRNIDPTHTVLLRRSFAADMNRRYTRLARDIRKLIADQRVFETRWRYMSSAQKVSLFSRWLQDKLVTDVLQLDGMWMDVYLSHARNQGLLRAYMDGRQKIPKPDERRVFMQLIQSQIKYRESFELLRDQAQEELKAINTAVVQQLDRKLVEGILQSAKPTQLASDMVKIVKSISVRRAGALARVEVIRAHANAQLDAFELLGIKKVGLKAEWHTAGDEKVCPKCKPLEGAVFTIAQARGLIPRHVNCRCCWLPIIKQRETYKRQVKKSLKLGAWDAASNID